MRCENNKVFEELRSCEAIIFASPTYMGGIVALFKAFADDGIVKLSDLNTTKHLGHRASNLILQMQKNKYIKTINKDFDPTPF